MFDKLRQKAKELKSNIATLRKNIGICTNKLIKNSDNSDFKMVKIETDRLIIRLAKPDDAEAIYSYRSDVIENRYQGWFPDSIEEVRDYISNMPKTFDIADICFQFAIIIADENLLIGDMGIIFTNHDKMQAEIGCKLDKDYQRKGYATEALSAIVKYLFLTLNKHRIIASVDSRNTASIRLIERLGFRKEAHFRESYYLRGEWVDDIIYAMLSREWTEQKVEFDKKNIIEEYLK